MTKLKRDPNAVPDLSRLPASYRRYIEQLQSRVATLEDALPKSAPTRVIVNPYEHMGVRLYLPDCSTVRFAFGDVGRRRELDVTVRRDNPGMLDITSTTSTVCVYPRVSNALAVQAVDR